MVTTINCKQMQCESRVKTIGLTKFVEVESVGGFKRRLDSA